LYLLGFEVVDLAPEDAILSRKSRIRSGPDFPELRFEGDDGRLKPVRPREVRLEECQDAVVKVLDPVDGPIGCTAKALTGLAVPVKLELAPIAPTVSKRRIHSINFLTWFQFFLIISGPVFF
jgi:hypothetical protein